MRLLELELMKGIDLVEYLEEVISKEKVTGHVLSVVGDLSNAILQCPLQKKPTILDGPLEIINLNGYISPEGAHLHLCISDLNCQVWGGHLKKGTKILKKADILIGINEKITIRNNLNDKLQKDHAVKVEIAILQDCPWSKRAIKILRTLNIPFAIIKINNHTEFLAIKEKSGMNTFPQIFIEQKIIGGYTELTELHASGKLESLRQ
tara:strand:+ start:208 stop:828 length:621 start_codon:yes stop_codon:yes gene_type:complete